MGGPGVSGTAFVAAVSICVDRSHQRRSRVLNFVAKTVWWIGSTFERVCVGVYFQKRRKYVLRPLMKLQRLYSSSGVYQRTEDRSGPSSCKNLPSRLLLHRGQAWVRRPWRTCSAESDLTADRFDKHRRTPVFEPFENRPRHKPAALLPNDPSRHDFGTRSSDRGGGRVWALALALATLFGAGVSAAAESPDSERG